MADPPRDVATALADLDPSFLLCRDLHHAWDVDHYATGGRGEVVRVLVCERCGTERVDHWTRGGARVASSYAYPEGYQLTGVEGSTDREAMRREVLTRAGITNRRRTR